MSKNTEEVIRVAMGILLTDIQNWNKDTLDEFIEELRNRYACAHGEFPYDFEF